MQPVNRPTLQIEYKYVYGGVFVFLRESTGCNYTD